eukprot:superscaffoldBa00001593_g11232
MVTPLLSSARLLSEVHNVSASAVAQVLCSPSTSHSEVFVINAEFKRITTMPLQSRFLSHLDLDSPSLLRVFAKRSVQQGNKL